MIFSMPLISTYPIPEQVKIWLGALVSFILFPMVAAHSGFVVPQSMPELLLYLFREFAIGYIIGFCATFLFAAVQIGGEFVSIQVGISMSQVLDPTTGESTQILSQMYTYLAAMVLWGLMPTSGFLLRYTRVFRLFLRVLILSSQAALCHRCFICQRLCFLSA